VLQEDCRILDSRKARCCRRTAEYWIVERQGVAEGLQNIKSEDSITFERKYNDIGLGSTEYWT
jgi:hypothetical protein